MSHDDGYTHEMGRLGNVSDRDLERLLAGEALRGDKELEALTSFVRDIKDAYTVSPDETTEARHLAAIVETAQLLADKGEPVARPASKADGPAQQVSRLPKWRRKLVFGWLESMVARVVAGGIAVAATMGGLAYAGALPEPVQEAAVDVADAVGITLPDPDEGDESEDAPAGAVDDVEAVEPEDPEVLTSDDEEDDADDGDDPGKDEDAAVAEDPADDADDSDDADGETADDANGAAAAAEDDSGDETGENGNGAAPAENGAEATVDDDEGAQGQDDEDEEDETEEESADN